MTSFFLWLGKYIYLAAYIYIYTTLLPPGPCLSAVYFLTMSNTSFCACSGLYQVFSSPSLLLNSAVTNSAKTLAFDLRRASLLAQRVINRLQCRRPRFDSWVGKIPWRRDKLPTPVFLGFPCGSAGKESACNLGDWVPSLGWEDSSGEGKDYPLQCSGPREFHGLYSPRGRKVRHDWATFTWPQTDLIGILAPPFSYHRASQSLLHGSKPQFPHL